MLPGGIVMRRCLPALLLFGVLAAAQTYPGQYPNQYPPGQYPPGQYPPGQYPNTYPARLPGGPHRASGARDQATQKEERQERQFGFVAGRREDDGRLSGWQPSQAGREGPAAADGPENRVALSIAGQDAIPE